MRKKNSIVRAYKKLLEKDRDWDYGFLLALERKKLERMKAYFSTSDIAMTDERVSRQISLCLRMLDIVEEKEPVIDNWYSKASECSEMMFHKNPDGKTYRVDFKYVSMSPDYPIYVNANNKYRFKHLAYFPENAESEETTFKQKYFCELYKGELRKAKAWHLYNLIREYKMFGWWN